MSDACMHCALWQVVRDFEARHPDGCVEDVLIALADVIGDLVGFDSSAPFEAEYLRIIDNQIKARIEQRDAKAGEGMS